MFNRFSLKLYICNSSKGKSFTSGEIFSHLFYVLADHVTFDSAASEGLLGVAEVGIFGMIVSAFPLDQRREVREVYLDAVFSKGWKADVFFFGLGYLVFFAATFAGLAGSFHHGRWNHKVIAVLEKFRSLDVDAVPAACVCGFAGTDRPVVGVSMRVVNEIDPTLIGLRDYYRAHED